MTGILNFVSHIGNYAGVGMIMFFLGIACIAFAIIKLGKVRRVDREMTVAEFNRQFVNDTYSRISDVEAGSVRKDIARRLNL